MITTICIKANGPVYSIYSNGPTAVESILIIGSCRSVAYLNYLHRYNEMAGKPFRIQLIDPWNLHWDAADNMQDFDKALLDAESDQRILTALRDATIFIHEHYESVGMFNTSTKSEKNIYQFGMQPRLNITIPNFHDVWALGLEQVMFDQALREKLAVHGRVTEPLFEEMRERGLAEVRKFLSVCALSDFPEMADYFQNHWKTKRMFAKGNHVNKEFTLPIFRWMNEKFLHLPLTNDFWYGASQEDLFGNDITPITQFDVDAYGLQWPEPIKPLIW
jgi:hypothetical protein